MTTRSARIHLPWRLGLLMLALVATTALLVTPTAPVASAQDPDDAPSAYVNGGEIAAARINTVDEFVTAYEAACKADPDTVIVLILNAYVNLETDRDGAYAMIGLVSAGSAATADGNSPTGFMPSRAAHYYVSLIEHSPQIARSYVGGRLEDGNEYPMADPETLTVTISRCEVKDAETQLKYFVKSNGKDMPTPMLLVRDSADEPWKLDSIGSVATDVRRELPKARSTTVREGQTVEVARIREPEEIKTAYDEVARDDPDRIISLCINACLEVETDPTLGSQMLAVMMVPNQVVRDDNSPTGVRVGSSTAYYIQQFEKQPEIMHSYVGGKLEDGADYPLSDPDNLTIKITRCEVKFTTLDGAADLELKYFVQSAGKSMPTPITLKRSRAGELWKVYSVSSLATGVRKE